MPTEKDAEKRLRLMFDGLGPSMFVGLMTPDGTLIEANRSALAAAAVTLQDVRGVPFEATAWWSYSPAIQKQLRAAINRAALGESSRYDVQVRGANNSLIDIDFSLEPLRGDDGEVAFLVPSAVVITERKQVENALRESTARFDVLAANINDALWIRSPDMRELHYISPAFERIWGVPRAQLYAMPGTWTNFVVPEDRERVQHEFAKLTHDTPDVDLDYRIMRPNGDIRWIRARGFQVRDATGRVIQLTGIASDITERTLATEEFRSLAMEISRTNRALRMLSASNKTLIHADREQDLLDQVCRVAVETGGYRMAWVGYAIEDAARSITPMAHAGFEDGYLSDIAVNWDQGDPLGQGPAGRAVRSGKGEAYEYSQESRLAPWADAARMRGYRSAIALPLRDGNRTFGLLCLHSADTDAPSADEMKLLQEMADNLGFGISNLRARIERDTLASQLMVSDRMASMGTLAAGVAHEINNPLAAVMANLDYVADSVGRMQAVDAASAAAARDPAWIRDEIITPLSDARHAAQRVRFIVRDLMVFSRTPSDEVARPVNIRTSLESTLRMARNEIRHRAQLITDFGIVPDVMGNEARLGQVFLNLVVNAAQALPDGHADVNEIRLRTRLEGERVIVEVSDTGPGIPPGILDRIFDAFFTTKEVGAGTGLGLAICHRIVTDMGGTLTVDSTVGTGTTFRVSLPVTGPTVVANNASDEPVPARGRRGHILVVDDDAMVARTVTRMLAADHDVVTRTAAREALALITVGESFDLILCDLMMPDMTGMEFYRELANLAPDQAKKMVFLTGGAFTASAQQFLSSTTLERMDKPFEPARLRALVRRFVQ